MAAERETATRPGTRRVFEGCAAFGATGQQYDIEGSLSMVTPYLRVQAGERLSFWSAVGSGSGSMSLSRGSGWQTADIDMRLAAAGVRFDTELGYGLRLPDGLTGTPYAGFGFGEAGARDYRLGWRLASDRLPSLSLGIETTCREAANTNEPAEHSMTLRAALRW